MVLNTTIQISIKEMEPHIKSRYHFALTSFARMFTPSKVDQRMFNFCREWSYGEGEAPLGSLVEVDNYFRHLWYRTY